MADKTILKNSKNASPENKPSLWKRIFRYFGWVIFIIPTILIIALLVFSQINPPFSYQMTKSYLIHGNINHEWLDFDKFPEDLGITILATEDENFCLHWGFDLKSSLANQKAKPTTLTQKAVRSLFLGHSEWAGRRVLETPLTILAELFWSKQRIMEVYLNHVGIGSSIFGVAAASQTIFEKNIATLSDVEIAVLAVMLEGSNEIDPKNMPTELNIRIAWILELIGELKDGGMGDCLTTP